MRLLAALAILLATCLPAGADLTGLQVHGSYEFADNRFDNLFDPVHGAVPEGSSGIQPLAVVADPDGDFPEFVMGTGPVGCSVDVDASTLTVTWFTDTDDVTFPAAFVTVSGLGGRVAGITVLDTVDFARFVLRDDWISVRTEAAFRVLADQPVVIRIRLDLAVPTEGETCSGLKAAFR